MNDLSGNDTMEYIQNNFINILQNALQEITDLSNNLNVDTTNLTQDVNNNAFFNTYIVNSFINNVITSNQQIQNVINESLYEKQPYKKVILYDELNKLETIIYNGQNSLNDTCSFTLDNLKINSEYLILPCNHAFNKEEIEKWLLNDSHLCPICRYEFPYEEIRNI